MLPAYEMMREWFSSRKAEQCRRTRKRSFHRPAIDLLEDRTLLTFSVVASDVFGTGGLRLVADFNQSVNGATVQASDLLVDGSQTAAGVTIVDADTLEFTLPALTAGTHSLAIAAGAISDTGGVGVDPFSRSIAIAGAAQYTMKHNPRLQPGNAPLAGFAGGALDRVDILWQTIPGGTGTQDTFNVAYRAVGATTWQSVSINAAIDTGVEGRVVRSATVTGLNWNSNYEYRARHLQGDVIVGQYQSTFRTRLQAGDQTAFAFAAYGDAASGTALGFRQVQGRINQVNPSFAVLLGDNVYDSGSHQESDSRFDPNVNPEAGAWMAGHIDYLGVGNHDIVTASGLPSEQNYSVPIPVAGVTAPAAPPASERPEHSYSWDYGDVHFITFDTNSLSDATRLDGLLNWVVTDLNASTARWKIVYGHHPLAGVPDKPESPSDNYYQQVVNRLKAAGVDLWMTGHSHTYSWTYPLTGQINGTATYINHGTNDQFTAGEGLTQLVSGVGGKEIRDGDYTQFPFVAAGFTGTSAVHARNGYSQINVTHNQITVDYVAADNGVVIDSFTISKDDTVQAATFQQGVNGYTGTVDTFLHQNAPTTSNATATSLKVDNDDPAGTGNDAQALLRFNNIFGAAAGQIPSNATIRSATLQFQVTNSGNSMNLHRMLSNWAATDTWNTLVGGVQANGVEAVAAPDTSTGTVPLNSLSFNVLPSLQAWQSNPANNRGWVLLPTGTDGVDFNSSEGATKPKLIVTYVLAPNQPPVAVNDTTNTNGSTPVTMLVLNNDTDPNGDLLTVQSVTQPAHGTATINAGTTITYTPAGGWFGLDSFTYTINDGHGGTASATASVTTVQTVSFQQGANGYTGTIDTFVHQNTPTVNNSAATSLNVDTDDPAGTGLDVQALLRFNNIFGAGSGQIPAGGTLYSATLQLQVTNSGNSMNLHRMLANWAATDTWSSLVNGVQNDGAEAVAAADVASGAAAVGVLSINVLTSLQAWLAAPLSNRGWVFLPTGTDGVDFYSAEGITPPKLVVSYIPNSPPTISDIANQAVNEDTGTGPVPFLIGDTETAPSALTVTATSSNTALVPNANLVLGGSGANRTLTATPALNQFGTTTITVTVTDAGGATATDTFVLTVNTVNDAPTISNIADQVTNEDAPTPSLAFTVGDVETPATALSVTATSSNPALVPNANLALGGSGANRTLTATPASNQFGTTTITVTVTDGNGATATDTFVLTVNSDNDAPTINDIADQSTNEDTATGAIAFTIDDIETPAAALSVSATSSNPALLPNAHLALGGSGPNRSLTATPLANQFGTTTITITVIDANGGTAADTFLLTVNSINDAPNINDIPDQVTNEDTATAPLAFTIGDLETSPSALTVMATSSSTSLVPNSNLVISGIGASRTVVATPAANQSGTALITITVTDADGATASDIFLLTVNAVNDGPTITDIADQTINEDSVTPALPFTIGDVETPAANLTVSVASTNTALVPNANLVLDGNGANRTLTATPVANQFGTATITVTVMDADGAVTSDSFVLTVIGVNDPPAISDIADQVTNEDTTAGPFGFAIGDIDTAPGSLSVTASSSNAALVPNANMVLAGSGANRTLTVTPAANQFGTAIISVTVTDEGGATATDTFLLTVNPVNDVPIISDITDQAINEDSAAGPVAFTVGDVETAAASLVVSATSSNGMLVPNANLVLAGSGANRMLTATPAANQFGTTTITVTVTDGDGASSFESFGLTVNPVNDAPTISDISDQATDEDTATSVLAFTVGDVESAAAALVVAATSSNPALVPNANQILGGSGGNRTLTATPAANQFGTAVITVSVTDEAGAVTSDTFVLTVNPVNDLPTVSDSADQLINEDTATAPLAFTIGDVETPASTLTVTATSSNLALFPNANIILGGSGANRTLTASPAPNQFGAATIAITVTDANGATATDTFVITVAPVNDAPTISDIANHSITENTTTGALSFIIGDIETEPTSLTVTVLSSNTSLVPNANLILGGSGVNRTIFVTPAVDQTGSTTITVTVTDGNGATAMDTFVVTVVSVTKFFVVDSADDKTFRYAANGAYLAQPSLAPDNSNSRGIAASPDGSKLWVLDKNKTVYVYNSALTLLGSWAATGLKVPTGISVSGTDVWIVDTNLDKVLVYAGAANRLNGAASLTRSFDLAIGNNNPEDLVTDGASVWVAQSGTSDKVFVYQATTGTSLGNWTIDPSNGSPTGITIDPTGASNSLWVVDNEADKVFEYVNARSRLSGSQLAGASFALNSANGNPQGIADPCSLASQALATPDAGLFLEIPPGESCEYVPGWLVVTPRPQLLWGGINDQSSPSRTGEIAAHDSTSNQGAPDSTMDKRTTPGSKRRASISLGLLGAKDIQTGWSDDVD